MKELYIKPQAEIEEFKNILDSLEKISNNANALKIWAEKNIKFE